MFVSDAERVAAEGEFINLYAQFEGETEERRKARRS